MTAYRPEDVTVVVSAVGRASEVGATLDSLRRQTVRGFPVIVVVLAGTALPEPLPEDVQALRVETAELMHAYDLAVEKAATPLLLVLSQGLEADPGLVDAHVRAHTLAPDEAVAFEGPVHHGHGDWLEGVKPGMNVSFKTARYGRAGSGAAELGGDEGSILVRLHHGGVMTRAAEDAPARDTRSLAPVELERLFQAAARTEAGIAAADPSFLPQVRRRVLSAAKRRSVSGRWLSLADRLPGPLRRIAGDRADRWRLQQVADAFLDSWEGQRDLAELREYLGDRYDHDQLVHHTAAVEDEEEAASDEAAFYRTSETYLYDLTVFAMSGTKAPYRRVIRRLVPPGGRLLDYGCGIGSDGLRLLDDGYRVEFADFDNPSTRFLRWRLDHRGLSAPIHDVDVGVPDGFDLAYCFDVIEHIDDPVAFLEELESKAAIVVVNFLEPTPDDIHLHKPLDVPALVDRATRFGLLWYRRYHGRSHLVAYRTGGGAKVQPVVSKYRRWLGTRRAPRAGEPFAR